MRLGLCCCSGNLPACFLCGAKRASIDWTKLSIAHDGFTGFAYATGDTESCSGTITIGFGDYDYNATQYFMDPADIPTDCELWQRPSSSVTNGFGGGTSAFYPCEWLWNDVRSLPCVVHRVAVESSPYSQVNSEHNIGTAITPVNAIDSADPWNREFPAISDSRCGDKVIPTQGAGAVVWECGYTNAYLSMSLRIYNAGVVGLGTSDQTVWSLTASLVTAWYGKTVRDWNGSENDQYDAVMPFFNPFTSSFAAVVQPDIPDSCFPFSSSDSTFGGGFASYRKLVDCDADFSGSNIVLPRATSGVLSTSAARASDWGITCPDDVTINLNYL